MWNGATKHEFSLTIQQELLIVNVWVKCILFECGVVAMRNLSGKSEHYNPKIGTID